MKVLRQIVQTEIFQHHMESKLQDKVNDFLHHLKPEDIIDIKMSHGVSSPNPSEHNDVYSTVVMIVYKKYIT
ncbi:sporulation protein Cse60 [Brevibacillus sp. SAFN-007a]|uniref:sporulation protein Cse60 n=1 Tax=Brevibacillus sp. SAFN-007a TaxID=3436862 RepID=UPI003F7DB5EA